MKESTRNILFSISIALLTVIAIPFVYYSVFWSMTSLLAKIHDSSYQGPIEEPTDPTPVTETTLDERPTPMSNPAHEERWIVDDPVVVGDRFYCTCWDPSYTYVTYMTFDNERGNESVFAFLTRALEGDQVCFQWNEDQVEWSHNLSTDEITYYYEYYNAGARFIETQVDLEDVYEGFRVANNTNLAVDDNAEIGFIRGEVSEVFALADGTIYSYSVVAYNGEEYTIRDNRPYVVDEQKVSVGQDVTVYVERTVSGAYVVLRVF